MTVHRLLVPDHRRYSSPAAHLYELIGKLDGVRVNGRLTADHRKRGRVFG